MVLAAAASISMSAPWSRRPAGLAMKTTRPAMSSGSPRRRVHNATAARSLLRRRGASASGACRWFEFVSGGRFGAQQIAHEIVPAAAHHVSLIAETVIAVGQQQQIEILVRLDQLVDHQ